MLLNIYAPLKIINKYKLKLQISLIRRTLYQKMNFTLTTKNTLHPYEEKNRLIMINILKQIGIILRTHGKA